MMGLYLEDQKSKFEKTINYLLDNNYFVIRFISKVSEKIN